MALSPEELRAYWTDGPGVEHIGEPAEAFYEYGAFNDESVIGPGVDIPDALRELVIGEPLITGTLWTVSRWARLVNEERARDGRVDRDGLVIIKRRTVVRTNWAQVAYDEINESLAS